MKAIFAIGKLIKIWSKKNQKTLDLFFRNYLIAIDVKLFSF